MYLVNIHTHTNLTSRTLMIIIIHFANQKREQYLQATNNSPILAKIFNCDDVSMYYSVACTL